MQKCLALNQEVYVNAYINAAVLIVDIKFLHGPRLLYSVGKLHSHSHYQDRYRYF